MLGMTPPPARSEMQMTRLSPARPTPGQAAAMLGRLADLVAAESPPGSIPHLTACADLLAGWGEAVLGRPARRVVREGLPHLLWAARDQKVLLLGHFDTVWPAGTVEKWPFAVDGDRATGPGVCDMKAGIVQMFAALAALPDTSGVGVLLTCDEESGSATSRRIVEEQALRSGAVLVCEPSNPDGALKVARKGGSAYRLTVHGRAAHAGVEPHRGVNATVEVAHQILAAGAFAAKQQGTSVTPTVLAAGTTSNTVPETATLALDVRAWTREELHRVDGMLRGLAPRLAGAALTLDGGINRYPLVPEVALPLLEVARQAARDLGLPAPDGAHAPGASDANFTGALGVATLDGLGAVGGGSHARSEYIDVPMMPQRAALLGALVSRLLAAPRVAAPAR
jgi:glutamate carboxypeptidase